MEKSENRRIGESSKMDLTYLEILVVRRTSKQKCHLL